jgi:glycosyltransferase involved in cell wall biosynthesis
LASWINQADKPVVFGGESIFFYKVIPHLKKGSKKVELCHLNTWISYSLAFIKYMDCRICSTPNLKREVGRLYKENNIPGHYFEKIFFIDNKVNIPLYREISNPVLEVLYAGRGAKQKRVHLIAEIAKQMHDMNRPVHFSFVGDVKEFVPETIQAHCTLFGSINKEAELDKIYQQSDVLILTSSYEGLPIAIMEMMARGKVIVSTAVDGIPDYITHKENGLLITESDETKIVESGINLLDLLINDRELQKEIGKKSYAYAVAHFSGELFCDSFHKMLQHEK